LYPKVGLVEETKTKGKERKIGNNNEIDHICKETWYNETDWNLLDNAGWGKGRSVVKEY
jgi:hypothetical protein